MKIKRKHNRAFSLVEMAIAMGIVGFAMVALLGLLPAGLRVARDTMDLTVRSQIVQLISNDLQLTDYDKLGDWSEQELYFNLQGLPESDGGRQIFTVKLAVLNGDKANAAIADETAKLVQVQIFKARQELPIYETALLIANTGDRVQPTHTGGGQVN
ncbi:MAG: Verru_Chthon cassette protein B [Verrucomicrobiales bacterium]|jgi:uncharacterized protein (TIGR02598 family)|nr:Verru_Chthon cassette protein B [Verrucomicrobiales bacterium]